MKLKTTSILFLNKFSLSYNRDVKSLEFLMKNIPANNYYGFTHNIQCHETGGNNYCNLKRFFYIKNFKIYHHLNSLKEFENIITISPEVKYIYLNKENENILFNPITKKHCTVIYSFKNFPLHNSEGNFFTQISFVQNSLERWFQKGQAEFWLKCN